MQSLQLLNKEANAVNLAAGKQLQYYPPLEQETRNRVDTTCAAFHLFRSKQTLRLWACYECGPIIPIRINGRLAWPASKIRDLLNGGK